MTTFDREPATYIAEKLLASDSTGDSFSDAVLTAPSAGYVSALILIVDLCPQNGGVNQ